MSGLQHSIIRASAGTGKTYQLAHRFLALLLVQRAANNLAPERMVATTFTRKGAGEFTERILERLAAASADPTEHRKLSASLKVLLEGDATGEVLGLLPGAGTDISANALREALVAVVGRLDRLALGTIDSLMARAVQTLEFELGLGGCEILDEPAAERERERLLGEVFARIKPDELGVFHQAIKRASLKSAASWRDELRKFVERGHRLLDVLPEASAWGAGKGGERAGEDWRREAEALVKVVEAAELSSSQISKSLVSTLKWIAARRPGAAGDDPPSWLQPDGRLRPLRDRWPESWECLPRSNSKSVCVVPPTIMGPLGRILTAWLTAEHAELCERTAALHEVLARYDEAYERLARRRGRLAFADLARLLDPERGGAFGSEQALQSLAFRWDQSFDHWLVDEFQDTSREQWRVLKPWLDDALQDDAGTKSVFVVGDTKQSIYGWRGGEPRLFDDLEENYPGRFAVQELAESWRSRPAVLELVNAVCSPDRNPRLRAPEALRAAALARWRFQDHVAADKLRERPGYAAVLLARDPDPEDTVAASGEAEEGERMAGQAAAIRDALERIRPLERGLSCAILVRRGANAQAVAAWLRRHGVTQVMVEGDCALAEQSPVVAAIVDALRWLLSPGHRFGFGHVSLTPIGELLREPLSAQDDVSEGAMWRYWTSRVAAEGAAVVTSGWCTRLAATEADPHVRFCLGHLDELARRSGRGLVLADWLEAVRRLTVRETAAHGTIHVMTIHKAKGLGFDVVFLPDLDLGSGSPPSFMMLRDGDGRPVGCVAHPPKWLRGWLPDLEQAAEAEEAVRQHEALCVLYVALTRAKEATFVIMREATRGRKADARDWVLGGLGVAPARAAETEAEGPWGESVLAWERGAREFAEGLEREGGAGAVTTAPVLLPAEPRRRRMRPSDAGHAAAPRSTVPVAAIAAATDYGTAVHKVFEQVEWLGQDLALSGLESAVADVRGCLEIPEVAALFRAEGPRDEALRELPIEFTDAGEWWSGVIDRLVLRHDASGDVREALIIDFKTDQVPDADALRERHAGQLAAYRRAVATALKLSSGKIRTVLVSTRLRCVVTV